MSRDQDGPEVPAPPSEGPRPGEAWLNPQQQACLARGGHLAVEAGAGSGKTRVLVERYLALLGVRDEPPDGRRPLRPQEIVAVTFTRKAAAQIRQRLRNALLEVRAEGDAAQRARASEALEGLARARVGTIDSFLGELLREHPLESGIDPGFAVVQGQERAWVEEDALAEVLREVAVEEGHPLRADLEAALEAAGGREALERRLRRMLARRDEVARSLELGAEGLAAQWGRWAAEDLARAEGEARQDLALQEAVDGLRSAAVGGQAGDKLVELCDAILAAHDALQAGGAGGLARLLDAVLTGGGEPRSLGRTGAKKNWPDGALEGARQAASGVVQAAARFAWARSIRLDPDLERAVAGYAAAQLRLAEAVTARYSERKRVLGVVDFEDLLEGAEALLLGPGREGLRARLAARTRALLLDEMQDTNRRQWRLFSALAREGAEPPETFLVGDPKQAIYSFRRADVRAFLEAGRELEAQNRERALGPAARSLSQSYRAVPSLVDFVNGLFEPLLAEEDGGFEVGFQALAPAKPEVEGDHPTVGMVLIPPPDEEDPAAPAEEVLEAEAVCRKLRELAQQGFAWRQMAVLLRRRKPLPDIEEQLRRGGVPYRVHGGVGFFQRQEVRDLVALLRFLADPGDDLSLAAVLRSPLVGLSDEALMAVVLAPGESLWDKLGELAGQDDPDERTVMVPEGAWPVLARARRDLTRWRALRDRRTPGALLREVVEDAGLWSTLRAQGDRGQAAENVEKLLRAAAGLRGDLVEAARYVTRLVIQEEAEGEADLHGAGEDAVHILTVHAAKGLEYPVVVVPDMDRKLSVQGDDDLVRDPDGHLVFRAPRWMRDGDDRAQTYAFARAWRRARQQTRAEEKRLLYVALTRAEQRLWMVGRDRGLKPVPRNELGVGSSWMDWVRAHCGVEADQVAAGEVEAFGVRVAIERPEGSSVPAAAEPAAEEGAATALDAWAQGGSAARALEEAARATPDVEVEVHLDRQRAPDRLAAPRPPETVSPTQLMDYRCPRYFHLRHVLGFDPSTRARLFGLTRRVEGGGGTSLGAAVHQALEAWGRDDPGGWRQGLDGWLREQAALDPEAAEGLRVDAARLVEQLLASPLAARLEAAPHSAVEQEFAVPVGGALLVGQIDRVIRDAEGWEVLDWKTNQPPPGADLDAWVQEKAADYRRQMLAYALAMREDEARGSIRTTLVFLRPMRVWTEVVEAGAVDAFRARVEADLAAMAAGRFRRQDASTPVTAAVCAACPFASACPEALEGGGGGEVAPEDTLPSEGLP